MRLIDANALKIHRIHNTDVNHPLDVAYRKDIDNAPTVDAVVVVHGRWEDVFNGKCAWTRYRCSVCKGYALYQHEQDELGKWKTVQALADYCSYCGARLEDEQYGNL